MTQNEFFDFLEKSKTEGFEWFFEGPPTAIRDSEGNIMTQRFIRARKQVNGGVMTFCPATVVAYLVTGKHFSIPEWTRAGEVLELDFDAALIVEAADKTTRFMRIGAKEFRERLIEVLQPAEPVVAEN